MTSSIPDSSPRFTLSETVSKLLFKHSHLDLTDEVELVDQMIRACGGYADVYCGWYGKIGKFVAVKQLRVHIQREEQLSKVSIVTIVSEWLSPFSPWMNL
jgi:hypothetical protein